MPKKSALIREIERDKGATWEELRKSFSPSGFETVRKKIENNLRGHPSLSADSIKQKMTAHYELCQRIYSAMDLVEQGNADAALQLARMLPTKKSLQENREMDDRMNAIDMEQASPKKKNKER